MEYRKYAFAKVGHFGLCHSLLAWARAVVWASENNASIIAPSWLSIRGRIGPVIRGERDWRQYHKLFHFPNYITGFQKFYLLSNSTFVLMNERADLISSENRCNNVFLFENLISNNEETFFHEIIGKQKLIKAELLEITKEKYHPIARDEDFIAVHIRRGDFKKMSSMQAIQNGAKNTRIPTRWFASMLSEIRQFLKKDVQAVVFSDGAPEEISEMLRLSNVIYSEKKASITDLLDISNSKLLISSGSGFSMWGCYLGDIPRISFPGQKFCSVNIQNFEIEALDFKDIPEANKKWILRKFSPNL